MSQPDLNLTIEELYAIVGELEVVRRKMFAEFQKTQQQISEMSQEIERLKNGKLGESDRNK
jgi:hypothetical protein